MGTVKVISLKEYLDNKPEEYTYGVCACGSEDFKMLVDNPLTLGVIGLQCSECATIVMFEEDDIVFEKDF